MVGEGVGEGEKGGRKECHAAGVVRRARNSSRFAARTLRITQESYDEAKRTTDSA